MDARRAAQLKDLLVSLGPTYVKLGQVLSSRQDLLPAPYVMELRTLQDAVPPFDDALARRILDQELGASGSRALNLGDAPPIASASLGQVYRGTIVDAATGETESVAVKVQRPGALAAISLDVGIIRAFAEPWRRFGTQHRPGGPGRRVGAAVRGGAGLRPRGGERGAVQARDGESPGPRRGGDGGAGGARASTRRVLTTGWIDGQRLDTSEEGDVPRLCAVALASYLAMLLDIGVLHADPHPGNLFRTSDEAVHPGLGPRHAGEPRAEQ